MPPFETESASESFYSGALTRISRSMLMISLVLFALSLALYGWRIALGFALGCTIAHINFHWLKEIVNRFAQHSTAGATRKRIVLPILLRYLFMGVAAYAILSVSPASLYGLFAGLFLPVAAIAGEAAYEAYVALARGI